MREVFSIVLGALIAALVFGTTGCAGDDGGGDSSGGDDADDDDGGGVDDDDTGASGTQWQDPPADSYMTWESALAYCEDLTLDDRDDWRLPSIDELRSLISGCEATETGGSCEVTGECAESGCRDEEFCPGCDYAQGPGAGGAYWPSEYSGDVYWYWSATVVADAEGEAWNVDFGYAGVHSDLVGYSYGVRCVRP